MPQRRPSPAKASSSLHPMPRFDAHRTDRFTSKFWLTPGNEFVPLFTFHYLYFADPTIAGRWGVPLEAEEPTRLAALRAGFMRVNYELNGGKLTFETIRWDPALRQLTTDLVMANLDAIDIVHLHRLDAAGQAVQLGCLPLQEKRQYGLPLTRRALSGWNNLRVTTKLSTKT